MMNRNMLLSRIAKAAKTTVLIFSDSHGSSSFLLSTAKNHPEADLAVHLGDHCAMLSDLARQCTVPLIGVAGNCDGWYGRHLPAQLLLPIAGHRVFLTHGHLYGVKHELGRLITAGTTAPNHADVILFGHTHQQFRQTLQSDGRQIILVNPGSCRTGIFGQPASAVLMHLHPDLINVEFLLDQS